MEFSVKQDLVVAQLFLATLLALFLGDFVPASSHPTGHSPFIDSRNNLWTPDSRYASHGNTTLVRFMEPDAPSSSYKIPLRFFPDPSVDRNCYRIPLQNSSLQQVLIRSRFYYKNYDGLNRPPSFFVSLGRAKIVEVNLNHWDPWEEEFIWLGNKETDIVPFCLIPIPGNGFPVISSLEIRPLPVGAYRDDMGDLYNKALRKKFRINCGYNNGPLRYPMDPYDRIWDADRNFSPSHLTAAFDSKTEFFDTSNIKEMPPLRVLQTARVLARKESLSYRFRIGKLGDYILILYFAGIIPVSSDFRVVVNGDEVKSRYTVPTSEVNALFVQRKGVDSLTIELRNISYYPLINAIEIYEVVDIPPECSSTAVSALKFIHKESSLYLGWQDDPCSPTTWKRVGCQGNVVASLDLCDLNLRSIGPAFSDLVDLLSLNLHNTSLAGQVHNLGDLQQLEYLNLSFNALTSFGTDLTMLMNLQILDLQNNSLEGAVPDTLGNLPRLRLLNLENNKLQGPLPSSLKRESLLIRTSGNVCLGFPPLTCLSDAAAIGTPEVTIAKRWKDHPDYIRKAIIISVVSGALVVSLLIMGFSFFVLGIKRRCDNNLNTPWQ